MNNSLLSNLKSEFGFIKYIEEADTGLTKEGWFLLEINPFSSNEDNIQIVSDILKAKPVDVRGGVIGHFDACNETDHRISSNILKRALKRVKPQTFLVAVYNGQTNLLGKSPVAIVLSPEINYVKFPDHPHLNMGFYDAKSNFYFPDSLCLAGRDHDWGKDELDRLLEAFCQISIWLYRHLVWVATREYKPKGLWIGSGANPLPGYCYPMLLNPHGDCHCGLKQKYKDCHRYQDLQAWIKQIAFYENKPIEEIRKKMMPCATNGFTLWKRNVEHPANISVAKLKSVLLPNVWS